MNLMKQFLMFSIVFFILFPCQVISAELEINIEPVTDKISLGEPFYINFIFENVGNRTLSFFLVHHGIHFKVTKSGITLLDESDGIMPGAINATKGMYAYIELEPQKTITKKVLFSQWFLFHEIGKYVVSCRMDMKSNNDNILNMDKSTPLIVFNFRPKEFIIVIEQKNKDHLKTLCESWIDIALEGANEPTKFTEEEMNREIMKLRIHFGDTKQQDAAKAISFIQDNVALPYLLRLMNTKDSRLVIIAKYGFRRIGTLEAAQHLIDIWNNKGKWHRDTRIKYELRVWRGNTTNNEIMEKIDKYIKEPPLLIEPLFLD